MKQFIMLGAGVAYLVIGVVNAYLMLEVMGRSGKAHKPASKRSAHRWLGRLFVVSTLVLLGFMMPRALWHAVNNEPYSIRIFSHAALGLALIPLLAIKLSVARRYRTYTNSLPVLGLAVAATAFLVIIFGAGPDLLVLLGG